MKFISKRREVRCALALVALVFCMYMPFGVVAYADDAPGASELYSHVLGDAVSYGIVTETLKLNGDAQTNVAAKKVVPVSGQTGNDLTNDVSQGFLIGSVDTSTNHPFHIKGHAALIHCAPESKEHIIHESKDIISYCTDNCDERQINEKIDEMMNHVSKSSRELSGNAANAKIEYNPYSQRYALDLSDKADGIYYVDVDKDTYEKSMSESEKLQIQKKSSQTVVFNVAASGNLKMQKYSINGQGADSLNDKLNNNSSSSEVTRSIIWNFTGDGSISMVGSVSGVLLAHDFDITTYSTGSGWIASRSVTIGSGEWHNTYNRLLPPAEILAKKDKPSAGNKNESTEKPDPSGETKPPSHTETGGGDFPVYDEKEPNQPTDGDKDKPSDSGDQPTSGGKDKPSVSGDQPTSGDKDKPSDSGDKSTSGDKDKPSDSGDKPTAGDKEKTDSTGDQPSQKESGGGEVPTYGDKTSDNPEQPTDGDKEKIENTGSKTKPADSDNPSGTKNKSTAKHSGQTAETAHSSDVPDTGDHSELLFHFLVLTGAAAGCVIILMKRRRDSMNAD
ncbi:hypothetical protein BHK98_08835 [Hornefia porci]|uniref:Choice-of-anchor A family protein n=1 Tax=Hornefia porci TaxID=2652292 RepID=A0A1Q9JJ47_9FIRM|nr:hypothetical protein [Hornefia porci]OLR56161.1 hypothetical protein BHK98_08835 [Hornefia porci]